MTNSNKLFLCSPKLGCFNEKDHPIEGDDKMIFDAAVQILNPTIVDMSSYEDVSEFCTRAHETPYWAFCSPSQEQSARMTFKLLMSLKGYVFNSDEYDNFTKSYMDEFMGASDTFLKL